MEFKLAVLFVTVYCSCRACQCSTITRRTLDLTDSVLSPPDTDSDDSQSVLDTIYQLIENSHARQPIADDLVQNTFDEVANDCPDCRRRKELEAKVSKEEMDRRRIEVIKMQILNKLHMKAPPNITTPLEQLPDPITEDNDMESAVFRDSRATQDEDRASEIFVFSGGVSGNCYNSLERPMVCLDFYFDTKIRHTSLESAELWVYKMPDLGDAPDRNQTLVLSEITNPNHSARKSGSVLGRVSTRKRRGWVKFDLKGSVYGWLRSLGRQRELEIICETCENNPSDSPVITSGQNRPFFKIGLDRRAHSRTKRSATCGPTITSCCVEPLYVDFHAIGWSWIRSPRGYYANYCRGPCRELTGSHEFHVSRVLSQVRAHTQDVEVQSHLTACCAPTTATPLNLIYFERDDSNSLIKRTLHNMIINSCGCL